MTSSPSSTGLSFDKTDKLQRRPFCQQLERYLIVESNYVEGSLAATLAASFGSGKTTFIEMWKDDLLKRRQASTAETKFTAPMPVVLNAWESDFCGDPLVDILLGLTEAIKRWSGADKPSPSKRRTFIQASKKAVLMAASLTNDVVAKHTGANYIKSEEWAASQMANVETSPTSEAPDIMELFKGRKQTLEALRKALQETFAPTPPPEASNPDHLPKAQTPKVIIFVDELDRCRPDYAIHYLETIKHVFNVKGLVFLLAINAQQLEVSARALFGEGLNFPEYYRKFSHRTFYLPQPGEEAIGTFLQHLVDKHITCHGQRSSALKPGDYIPRMVAPIVHAWKVNPRQLEETFRILGHSLAIERQHGTMRTHNTTISLAYLFACLARTAKEDVYRELQVGRSNLIGHSAFRTQAPMDERDTFEWIYIIRAGTKMELQNMPNGDHAKMQHHLGNADVAGYLRKIKGELGHQHSTKAPFHLICEHIENALHFEDEQVRV